MALRDIIQIDETLCDGCALCVPACHEGALAVIGGKLRVVDDARCDGAGACVGECPKGALTVIKRDAVPFDEASADAPPAAPIVPSAPLFTLSPRQPGCPSTRTASWTNRLPTPAAESSGASQPSELRQWPVQLHLVSPDAPFWSHKEMLLAADCVGFSFGAFHGELLRGRSLAIACPKLDDPRGYSAKLTRILATKSVSALRVLVMEVPCCSGLARLALDAVRAASFDGEVEVVTVSIMGGIVSRRIMQPDGRDGARSAPAP